MQRPLVKTLPLSGRAWSHRASGCLRISLPDYLGRFLCGRAHSDVYRATADVGLEQGQPHCKQCWSHTSLAE